MHRRRLVIDATPVLGWGAKPVYGGIARVSAELIRALGKVKEDLPFDVVLFGQRVRGKTLRDFGFSFPSRQLFLPKLPAMEALKRWLPIVEAFCPFNLFHAQSNYAAIHRVDKAVVTIHDAMYYAYPEQHLNHARDAGKCADFARRCRAILTPSQFSKDDIVRHMGVAPEKVHVLPWGVDRSRFFPVENLGEARERLAARYGLRRPFFVAVSCDIGRKNSPLLVDAYLELLKEGCRHDLVMVWRQPPEGVRQQVVAQGAEERVHFLSGVEDSDLRLLYGAATASVFPSVYEGFGLPVLESMACGTPVVTTRCSSLPEVGGDAALYVPPNDIRSLVETMRELDGEQMALDDIRQRSLAQAGRFTWEGYVERLVPLYEKWLAE